MPAKSHLRRLIVLAVTTGLAFAGSGGVHAASSSRTAEHPTAGRGAAPSSRQTDQMQIPAPVRAAALAAGVAAGGGPAPFLTRPYMGWHSVNSWFDHCNPDYSIDGRICTVDGTVALSSNGTDPGFPKGYAVNHGAHDYLYYDGHNGFDLGLVYEELLAAAPGLVTTAGIDPVPYNSCFGNTVVIDHGNGFSTRYAHMLQVGVSVGQTVARGQHLGISGTSGCSTGPHLHFGFYRNSPWTAIDPWGWLGTPGADPWPADQGDMWLTGNPHDPIPDAPTQVVAALTGQGVTVSWTAGFDGGSGVTGFTVTASPGNLTATAAPSAASLAFPGLQTGVPYTFTVTAANTIGVSPRSAPSNEVTISGAPTRLALGTSANVTAGQPATVQVTAVDGLGHRVSNYTGKVHLSTADASATLPTAYAFQPADAGSHAFTFTLVAGGLATVTASDAGAPPLTGSAALTVQPAIASASSSHVYSLSDSDGSTWADIDPSALQLHLAPGAGGTAVITASADLWTEVAGFNQDLAIFLSQDGGPDQLLAWKESGGIAAGYSPNATAVEATAAVAAGHSYVAKVRWKTNRPAPGVTIHAGAGVAATGFSPTTVAAQLLPAAAVISAAAANLFSLGGSDGSTWKPVGPAALGIGFTPTADGSAVIGGSADLWTDTAGYNQDLGIFVSGAGGPESLIAWKEGGGIAAGYSPNAVYVLATIPVKQGVAYSVRLQWKTNRAAPGVTIYAGAGVAGSGFSPTRLSARLVPAATTSAAAVSTLETLSPAQAAWTPLDVSHLSLTVRPGAATVAMVAANRDLWTESAGVNQDIGLYVSVNGDSPQLLAWKESGGSAAYSPNGALLLATLPLDAGSTYGFSLRWKANQAGAAALHGGAGTSAAGFSPSDLQVLLSP